ncbi:TM2 domain-containing protein [Clostridium polynesiense]|uniref:TM2 domain-containing protein n=1 Tax=Clostridium polynesiense TaxID=1325933 RepID=UPI00058E3203|nr:TM2 domain-containing protein [Clostridium polynesiense]
MYCRNCGGEIDTNAKICIKCGVEKFKGTAFCHNCGNTTEGNAAICTNCGVELKKVGGKSKMVAGILGLLLGGLGVHRFYLGYMGIGILQLVLTFVTCGISSIWGFIEGILILIGNFDKDADGNSLTD